MNTRNVPGGKGRPGHKADYKMWSLDVSQPYGPPRPVTGTALSVVIAYENTVLNIKITCYLHCVVLGTYNVILKLFVFTLRREMVTRDESGGDEF
jgi:hypothetical protein